MKKVEPDNFLVKYGGFGRISWQVRWERGQVKWRRFAPEWTEIASEEFQPEPQHWIDFWQSLDESRIWDWNEVYYRSAERASDPKDENQEDSDDVISWSVEILLKDGRLVDSSGSNAVPGETRLSRRGRSRGRGRGRRDQPAAQKPPAKTQRDRSDETTDTTADPTEEIKPLNNNSGIPDDTFDQFLHALRLLLGGREFANDEIGAVPETLPTQYRARTVERTDRPDPFAEEEKQAKPQGSPSRRSGRKPADGRRNVRGANSRTAASSSSNPDGTTRKRSRRSKKRPGEGTESTVAATGNPANPKRRRRRRPSKPAGAAQTGGPSRPESSGSSGNSGDSRSPASSGAPRQGQGQGPGQEPRGDGDGTQKKRRRRRRRRKPGGDGAAGSSAGPAPGN
ncbi:MAG: hypothetical protein OSB09_08950 [Planctomycetota bacterium]|nr:hypothetical protein [Planctomycetota bacterium]